MNCAVYTPFYEDCKSSTKKGNMIETIKIPGTKNNAIRLWKFDTVSIGQAH